MLSAYSWSVNTTQRTASELNDLAYCLCQPQSPKQIPTVVIDVYYRFSIINF